MSTLLVLKRSLCVFAFLSSTLVAAADRKISYPPSDAPLFLLCKLQKAGSSTPTSQWEGLGVYFPSGLAKAETEMRIVDPHVFLEGNVFDFSIRDEKHWSLIAKNGAVISQGMLKNPQIMFLPPQLSEDFRINYMIGPTPKYDGVCFGMTGPNTESTYTNVLNDPAMLDR